VEVNQDVVIAALDIEHLFGEKSVRRDTGKVAESGAGAGGPNKRDIGSSPGLSAVLTRS
jgi:hypothetical protein